MPGDVSQYSPLTGLVYIFNLIVGTGALTLPAAFHNAGWLLSAIIISVLAFMSYLTATFMIESMAAANAVVHWKRLQRLKRSDGSVSDELIARTLHVDDRNVLRTAVDSPCSGSSGTAPGSQSQPDSPAMVRTNSSNCSQEKFSGRATPSNFHYVNRVSNEAFTNFDDAQDEDTAPLLQHADEPHLSQEVIERIPLNVSAYYDITEVFEMGKMADMFFNKTGRTLFYLCIAVYLYGDLAIYATAVAKSLRDVSCTYNPQNVPSVNMSDTDRCWKDSDVTRIDAYRFALTVFVVIVAPFAFCNITKTKYIQILTTLMRWLAFGVMVTLASLRLARGKVAHPDVVNVSGLPNLFGACVYSFMCHHSLPGLVTPISRKKNIYNLILTDYIVILLFYCLLSLTGIFTFKEINDLYTLNFQPKEGEAWYLATVHYFLSLFPVFTLSSSFPIIAITLTNNLKALFLTDGRMYSWCTRRCLFPLAAVVPPLAVAFATNNLEFLVGITGSYAGAGVQYIVPAFLVYTSRKRTKQAIGIGVTNNHSSFFKSTCWVYFVNAWAIGCIVLVTWNHIANAVKS